MILKYRTYWFDILLCYKMTTTIVLANTSTISEGSPHHIITFFLMMKAFTVCSFSNFWVYNTIFLNIIPMLYIRLQNIFILKLEICAISPTSSPPTPSSPNLLLFLSSVLFCFVFVLRVHVSMIPLYNADGVDPCCHKWQTFLHFYKQVLFHLFLYVLYFVYPFTHWQILRLLTCIDYCK